MAYVAKRKATASGLYRFLADAEHAFYDRWREGQRRRAENGCAAEVYSRQRRLAAFAEGAPVNVSSGEIFGWGAVQAGAPAVARPAGAMPLRAIVAANDSVVFNSDDWAALFVEENGL